MKPAQKPLMMKRAKKMIPGLRVSWTDPSPATDDRSIVMGKVTHKNPVLALMAEAVWSDFGPWIMKQAGLLWRVEFTIFFSYPNGLVQHESRCIVENMALFDLAHACEPAIKEAGNYGANPVAADYRVECLGMREKCETDYIDYEEVVA